MLRTNNLISSENVRSSWYTGNGCVVSGGTSDASHEFFVSTSWVTILRIIRGADVTNVIRTCEPITLPIALRPGFKTIRVVMLAASEYCAFHTFVFPFVTDKTSRRYT